MYSAGGSYYILLLRGALFGGFGIHLLKIEEC
jgi:hypothetical protein